MDEQTLKKPSFRPALAVVCANTLTGVGMQSILQKMVPFAVVNLFHSFEAFQESTPELFFHFFVSRQIFFTHTAFFTQQKHKTVIMIDDAADEALYVGFHTLNICLEEHQLLKEVLTLHQGAHHGGHHIPEEQELRRPKPLLSPREIEVLVLLAKGFLNKEIAQQLNIGITTVITHRKNIIEKTGLKSLSSLTIYAVVNGYVEADII